MDTKKLLEVVKYRGRGKYRVDRDINKNHNLFLT